MKSIIDFYECGLNATPTNTMGMGNPMPATENTPGSEPLVPAKKCKKAKCKKEKIDEASILDIEGNMQIGDDFLKFAEYFVNSYNAFIIHSSKRVKDVETEALNLIKNGIIKLGNNSAIIDVKLLTNGYDMEWHNLYPMYIGLLANCPKTIKKIVFINVTRDINTPTIHVESNVSFDIEAYSDDNNTPGELVIMCKEPKLKLKNIICGKLILISATMKTLSFNMISANEINFDNITSLSMFDGKFNGVKKILLTDNFIKNYFNQFGVSNDVRIIFNGIG
jgi:hypothetical protein